MLDPYNEGMVGAVYMYRREFAAALAAFDAALRLDSSFATASLFKVFVYLAQGHSHLAAVSEDQGVFRSIHSS